MFIPIAVRIYEKKQELPSFWSIPKTTPMSGDLLEGLSIKLINNPLAKVYYLLNKLLRFISDVGRLHSWIIRGKDMS